MQYFAGLHKFQAGPLLDLSMMVDFCKRFPVEEMAKISRYVCTGKWPEDQRSVGWNDNTDDGDEPLIPPHGDGGSGNKASTQTEKANPNTSKKKRSAGKGTVGNCFYMPWWLPPTLSIPYTSESREYLGTAVNFLWQYMPHTSHKFPYSAKKARKSYSKLA